MRPTLCDPMDCSTPGPPVSPTPGACSNSCPSSRWCHPTISSSVVPFSFCLQSFLASGSFPMSQLFTSGGQRTGASSISPSVNRSWCMILLMYCWSWFASILLRIFTLCSSVMLACNLFVCEIFVCFQCQGNNGPTEWVWKCSFLCKFFGIVSERQVLALL